MTHKTTRSYREQTSSITAMLICHPATPSPLPVQIDVSVVAEVRHAAPGWQLRYTLRGPIDQLSIPAPQTPGPADGLWRHTCFEAFVGTAQSSAYREFNFSPSGQWAVYSFSAERQRVEQDDVDSPTIEPWLNTLQTGEQTLVLEAWLPAPIIPAVASGECLSIGLNAVIQTRDGQLSYWALTHPRDQPDFHHADGRGGQLPHPSAA